MRRADIVCSGLILALALVVVVEGLRLGVGWGSDGPQSGFFVFYLGLALLASSGVVLARAWLGSDPERPRKSFAERGQLVAVAKVLVPAGLMVLLTHGLGLYVSGALYLGLYMRWIGRHPWAQTVVLSVSLPLVTFLIFEVWFLVPMPKGPIEAYLGY